MQSIVEMLAEQAKMRGDKVCIIDSKGRTTYRQLYSMACGTARELQQMGVKKGDRVVVEMTPASTSLSRVLGIHLLGGYAVPVERKCPAKRISCIVKESGVKACYSKVSLETDTHWKDLDEITIDNEDNWQEDFPDPEDIGDIMFTTGTTGKSKGVMLSHRAIVAKAENVCYHMELTSDDVSLIPTPLNHGWGLSRSYAAIMQGGTIVLMNGIANLKKFFECLETEKISHLVLTPAMLAMLFQMTGDKLSEYKKTIRCIETGSAPIGEQERKKLLEYLARSKIMNVYGSTEAGCTSGYDMNKEGDIPFCVGYPSPNTQFEFVDEDGNIINADQKNPGRIITSGPVNMSGYYGETKLTEEVMRDGKIYSNDWGWQDEKGRIFLLGRKGDVINMGGIKISAWEIEQEAIKWGEIKECACVPIPSVDFGEVPKLYVVPKVNGEFHQNQFLKHMKDRMEFSRIPKEIEVIQELPRTYNGKIIKKGLGK